MELEQYTAEELLVQYLPYAVGRLQGGLDGRTQGPAQPPRGSGYMDMNWCAELLSLLVQFIQSDWLFLFDT
jgi:hypothetical protein